MPSQASKGKRPSLSRKERLESRTSAELQGRTLKDFVIAGLHDAAVRTIGDMQSIQLTEQESQAFAEAMLNPREPADRLRSAARRYIAASAGCFPALRNQYRALSKSSSIR